jgi:hypothetical protein
MDPKFLRYMHVISTSEYIVDHDAFLEATKA